MFNQYLKNLWPSLLKLLLRPIAWADAYQRDKYLVKKSKKRIDPWSYYSNDKRDKVRRSTMLIWRHYGYAALLAGAVMVTCLVAKATQLGHHWYEASNHLILQFVLVAVSFICTLMAFAILIACTAAFLRLVFQSGFRWQARRMMRYLPDDFELSALTDWDQSLLDRYLKWVDPIKARGRQSTTYRPDSVLFVGNPRGTGRSAHRQAYSLVQPLQQPALKHFTGCWLLLGLKDHTYANNFTACHVARPLQMCFCTDEFKRTKGSACKKGRSG